MYDLYWTLANRQLLISRSQEIKFYRDLLVGFKKGDLVFDIGANDGTKAEIFLRLGAKIVAVEPDQTNQKVLQDRFLSYRLNKKPLTIVGKAVSSSCGEETMWVDAPGSWMNTLNPKWVETLRNDTERFGSRLDFAQQIKVETVTIADLIRTYGLPFFIKVDVEGYEPKVLQGLPCPVRYLSFEVNLPEFLSEGMECIKILGNVDKNGEFNYAGELQKGLILPQWVRADHFLPMFTRIDQKSVEVFWKTGAAASGH
jgi:FkbM family methyltransferase